jgi:glycosyltransferase involved in cell wall biosynthesis
VGQALQAADQAKAGPIAGIAASVIICTRDRAAKLRRMLHSVCDLAVPDGTLWELLVIDNGSSDNTVAVVESFRDRLPIRRLEAPTPGVSHARNLGIEEARGEYICWTDDDVLVDRDWLAAYLEAFRRHPQASYFGGRIEPLLEPPSPRLIARCKDHWPLDASFAARDFGDEIRPLSIEENVLPFGANFAVSAEAQRALRYNEQLGPSPVHRRLGEEMDVIYRMAKNGAVGWWVPGARVHHVIGPERQSIAYLIDFYRRSGNTNAYFHDRFPGENVSESLGRPGLASTGAIALRLRMTASLARASAAAAVGRPCSALGHIANCAFDMGVLSYRRAAPHRNQPSAKEIR